MNNVIKGPWQRSPQHHCNVCGSTAGRAAIKNGVIVCYDCVTDLYWSAIQHESAQRRAAEEDANAKA